MAIIKADGNFFHQKLFFNRIWPFISKLQYISKLFVLKTKPIEDMFVIFPSLFLPCPPYYFATWEKGKKEPMPIYFLICFKKNNNHNVQFSTWIVPVKAKIFLQEIWRESPKISHNFQQKNPQTIGIFWAALVITTLIFFSPVRSKWGHGQQTMCWKEAGTPMHQLFHSNSRFLLVKNGA